MAAEGSSTPALTLPKGGGAIRGLGEKFAVNLASGTGSMSVPIATSPGRSGFGPQLSLSYDSGVGNGPFGFGWTLSLPAITRKTDKGLPQYVDAAESDVFILAGAEDLVPVYRQNPDETWVRDASGALVVHEEDRDGYHVRRYRPRIEGLFARIERWSRIGAPDDVHWRSISKDNILTLYGLTANARVLDPDDPRRVFSWLICETRDDKGNGVLYRYKTEDGVRVDLASAHQRNRGAQDDVRRTANRFVKRIQYGNRSPLLDDEGERPRFLDEQLVRRADWMFEVVFDYGDHDDAEPKPNDDEARDNAGSLKYPWSKRPDAFSTYRSGFEVRTARLCRRVLMFHHFPDEAEVGRDCLVRSTDFAYSEAADPEGVARPVYSFLRSVTQSGYRRDNAGYAKRSMPPLEFKYAEPEIRDVVESVDLDSVENLPVGLDGGAYRWTDLHGEGIPGILTEQADSWFYKRNWSAIPEKRPDGSEETKAKFAAVELVAAKPNAALTSGAEFLDLAGDGLPDLVVMDGPVPGLYEHDDAEAWQTFRPFTSRLNRAGHDPNVRFVDLDGDGQADVLITEQDALVWHPSLAEEGFAPARRVAQALDEEKGPRVVFADSSQSVFLADLSGDGLADLVRIRNGDVCYWPNLGYGRFGAKVTMDNAPRFDAPDQFDPRRIRLADIDGSGTTDIIYIHRDGVRLYFNQSGNAWSQPRQLPVFPRVDDIVNIVPTDLLGNGTACLVWSSSLPDDAARPMRYVNLMGGGKPHLLIGAINNLGAETRIDYAPSTKFYLQDKRDGRPWVTRLPFPVHVVERVETYDHLSRNRFVTRHAYHHGYFDGDEREFRGFGLVEQWDTEAFSTLGAIPSANSAAASHVPPVLTRSWFHTGAYLGRETISRHFEGEYFADPGLAPLDDTILPGGLTVDEEREACRALKGSLLRREVYADDLRPNAGAAEIRRARTPYVVTEANFTIRGVQTRGGNRHAVFFVHPREAITAHYERRAEDPRVEHAMTLAVDAYGNVLEQTSIVYGRRRPDATLPTDEDRRKQSLVHITHTENSVTNAIARLADHYRSPMPAESRTFELRKPRQDATVGGVTATYRFDDVVSAVGQSADGQHAVPYEDVGFAAAQQAEVNDPAEANRYFRRLIECVRTLYRPDDCGAAQNDRLALLARGTLERLALPGASYRLAFTPGLLAEVFQRLRQGQANEALLPNPAQVLGGTGADRGGYVDLDADGRWWIPSGQSFFATDAAASPATELKEARRHFFLPRRYRDPFGSDTLVDFDSPHDLLVVETRDTLRNRLTAKVNDYRVLQPRVLSDANRNQTEVTFDTLGLVAGTAVMGKPTDNPRRGDRLDAPFTADPPQADVDAFVANPREATADPDVSVASQAAHDLLANATTRVVYDVTRFMRVGEAPFAATIARETHVSDLVPGQISKLQIAFSYSDGFGREIQKKIQAEPGPAVEGGPDISPRWVGSGWTIFNNKGKPVRQYEPFFSTSSRFEFGAMTGVSPVLFYDPVERVIATLHPNHTYEKVLFDAWQQATYDVNDTSAARNAETGDPRTDPDIGGYVAAFFQSQPANWQTWRAQRATGLLGQDEQAAADRAAAHADTPAMAYFDSLGRAFLNVVSNRVVCTGHDLDGTETRVATRIVLDIEGNQRAVRDERQLPVNSLPVGALQQRVVMRSTFDMLGALVHTASMEAGERWSLNDVAGRPIRAWDTRGHTFITTYDALRRPVARWVRGTTADSDPRTLNRDTLFSKVEYGEAVANAESLNLRTRTYRQYDGAGELTNARLNSNRNPVGAYDFKGNLQFSTRRLATSYSGIPDWSQDPDAQLDDERFEGRLRYDALNRSIQSIATFSSVVRAGHPNRINVVQPTYNDANLLERVDVWLERATDPAALLDPGAIAPSAVGVAGVDYDAKGRRLQIDYKNGTSTSYQYDRLTLRLTRLASVGPLGQVQDLHYTYDPAGNIVHIHDDAQQAIYFTNQRVDPSSDYVYDSLYRLVQADGREHLGQNGRPIRHSYNDAGRVRIRTADAAGRFAPNDLGAMGRYIERYVYDAVGNVLQMQHERTGAAVPGWTRRYRYAETSLLEPGRVNNRLTRTKIGNGANESYSHDVRGNMRQMPQLQEMRWDFTDRLQLTTRQRVNNADADGIARNAEKTFYVCDASGQRVRKVTELGAGGVKDERIYVPGCEIYRRHGGAADPVSAATATFERETLHVMDDTQRIAMVETRSLDSAGDDQGPRQLVRYQLTNHLGSASLELDDAGGLISYEEYSPYGSTTYEAVRRLTEAAKRYRYTGKERDEESGLCYHGARYYAPWLGRWCSPDPAGITDGLNVFAYCRGAPTQLVDRGGRDSDRPKVTEADVSAVKTQFTLQSLSSLQMAGINMMKLTNPPVGFMQEFVHKRFMAAIGSPIPEDTEQDVDAASWNPAQSAMTNFSLAEERSGRAVDALKAGNVDVAKRESRMAGAAYGRHLDALGALIGLARAGAGLVKGLGEKLVQGVSRELSRGLPFSAQRAMTRAVERSIRFERMLAHFRRGKVNEIMFEYAFKNADPAAFGGAEFAKRSLKTGAGKTIYTGPGAKEGARYTDAALPTKTSGGAPAKAGLELKHRYAGDEIIDPLEEALRGEASKQIAKEAKAAEITHGDVKWGPNAAGNLDPYVPGQGGTGVATGWPVWFNWKPGWLPN